MTELAYGGLVWRPGPSGTELLLIHRPRYDDWGLPKGKPNPGELPEETAVREVEEETGLVCRLGKPAASKSYIKPDGVPKSVRYWAMIPVSGDFAIDHEVDTVRWVPLTEAPSMVSYESDRDLLLGLAEGWMEPVPRLFLVRHADAGNRDPKDKSDRYRTLSVKGWREARGLVGSLRTEKVYRLLASPYVRCRQTLEPLGEARSLTVEETDDLGEDQPQQSLPLLAKRDAVLCTHGNVIAAMLDALLEDGCEFLAPRIWPKGSTWIVDFEGQLPARARYLPPPA